MRLRDSAEGDRRLKVPHVGWNRIYQKNQTTSPAGYVVWKGSVLEGLLDGDFMYFVHSFYPTPVDHSLILSTTRYGPIEFCSSIRSGSVFACQFHPERSGSQGLRVYRNLAISIQKTEREQQDVTAARSKIRTA